MSNKSIGQIFGQLQTLVDDAGDLTQPLSAGPFEKSLSLDTGNKSFQLFHTPVSVEATFDAKVQVLAPGAVPDSPFPEGKLTLPHGDAYTPLTIDGSLAVGGQVNATQGVLALSASASTKTAFAYSHLRPAISGESRLQAFLDLGRTSQLPQTLHITDLAEGEAISLTTTLNADLNLEAKYGKEVDLNGVIGEIDGLFGGGPISFPLRAHIGFSVKAAFGLSLYDALQVVAARALTQTPGWVRIRVERQHRSRITFGVAVDLSVAYDATAGAKALLDRIFSLVPKIEAVETLKKIADVAANAKDFDAFKQSIGDAAAGVIGRLVDDLGWKQALQESGAVSDLIKFAKEIVTAYDGIDAKVQSIIEEVLARFDAAGLAKVKPIIDQIAAIDPKTFSVTSLIGGGAQDVLHWLEVLSGTDVEELLLSAAFRDDIARAVEAAKKIQAFLSGGASEAVLKKLHDLLDRSGAAGFVAFLKKNATSVQDLQKADDQLVGDVVRRLVNKELALINDDDLKKVQAFAKRLDDLLNAPAALQAKLAKGISRLKGKVGFSLSLEISRVTETSALVDVELNPKEGAVVNAAGVLLNGHVQQFLAALNAINVKDGDPLPFRIRDVALASRRVRTSAATTFLSLFGNLSEVQTTIDSTSVTVKQVGNNVTREGLYIGGSIAKKVDGSTIAEGATWLRVAASGTGSDVDAAYQKSTPVLRLTYAHEDTKTGDGAIRSLVQLSAELGLNKAIAPIAAVLNKPARFALELEFGPAAVKALKQDGDIAGWNGDVLTAAHRWFLDADRGGFPEPKNGAEMAAVVLNANFRKLFGKESNIPQFFDVDFGVNLFHTTNAAKFKPNFLPLQLLITSRPGNAKNFSRFEAAKAVSTNPKDLIDATREASDMFRSGNVGWEPPMFNFWLVLARLLRLAPAVFDDARAVCTITTRKADAPDDWNDPVVLDVLAGIKTGNLHLA